MLWVRVCSSCCVEASVARQNGSFGVAHSAVTLQDCYDWRDCKRGGIAYQAYLFEIGIGLVLANVILEIYYRAFITFVILYCHPHSTEYFAAICQEYFLYFIAIEILSQHFCQILQNISSQHYNFNFLQIFENR